MFVFLVSLYILASSGCVSTEKPEEIQVPQPPVLSLQTAQSLPPQVTPQTTPQVTTTQLQEKKVSPPPEVLYNFCSGYHALLDGDWEKAVKYFETALEKDPHSERLLKYIVGCYMQVGKKEEALRYVERLSEIAPDDFRIHYTLADIYQREGKIDEAIEAFEKATRSTLDDVEPNFVADALYRLANLYLERGQPLKAVPCLKDILKLGLSVDQSILHCQIGIAYAEVKDFQNAKEHLERTKALNPALTQARIYLAMVYEETGELQKAIEESEAFLDGFPQAWVAYAYLAGLYKKASRPEDAEFVQEKAINILTKQVATGTKDPKEYLALAQLLIAQQKQQEAQRVLESGTKVIEKEKSHELRMLLASLYYEANCEEAVEEELKEILKIDPDSAEASNFLGYFYAEKNKELEEALKLVEKALQAEPQNAAYLDSLGWIYYKQATGSKDDTRLEKALQKLLEAASQTPDPEIFKHLGEIYYSLGQWDAAEAEWQKALQIQPRGSKDEQILRWIQDKLKKLNIFKKLEEEQNQEEYPGI